jgi:hypothetical protein
MILSCEPIREIVAAKRYLVNSELDVLVRKREVAIHQQLQHANVTRFIDMYVFFD